MLHIEETKLPGSYLIKPEPLCDNRGTFARVFCKNLLAEIGLRKEIVQINHSLTVQKGAVRGMHYQCPPMAEIKLVKCIQGAVYDVIIDLRKDSPTFMRWHGEKLSAENMHMIYVPEGFAHGFQVMEQKSELIYLHSEFYRPEYEGAVRHDDPKVDIRWPLEISEISERDRTHPYLTDYFRGLEV
jgi:dTDP-4-dehydrorhamnose 3,5-epimerase